MSAFPRTRTARAGKRPALRAHAAQDVSFYTDRADLVAEAQEHADRLGAKGDPARHASFKRSKPVLESVPESHPIELKKRGRKE